MNQEYKIVETVNPLEEGYKAIIKEIEVAISYGVLPKRIKTGSSGSYYISNKEGKKLAVFKPKDEEPYGRLNPKWIKFIHRTCSPCCFGRGCIIPNIGYLCETAASLVDQRLQLDIVPETIILKIASPSFNYSAIDRAKSTTKKRLTKSMPSVGHLFHRIGLPPKIGSYQKYEDNCENSMFWLKAFENNVISPELKKRFHYFIERMIVLDYIIRNTDRTPSNWLIRYNPKDDDDENSKEELSVFAIDHGLSFPFKHPDQWRAYPYHWSWLSYSKIPFSNEIKRLVLPKLDNLTFVESLCQDLYLLFSLDSHFDSDLFEKQMNVMRGQISNLVQALKGNMTPTELIHMPTLLVEVRPPRMLPKFSPTPFYTKQIQSSTPIFTRW